MPGAITVAKVQRGATPANVTQTAAPATLKGVVAYPDGTQVRIVRVARGAQTAQGPGAFPGNGFTAVEIEVKAGTQPVDLSRVVVTALAGSPQAVVNPVYVPEAKTADFSGKLAARAKTTARYAFAIKSGAMRVVVDLDDAHANAVFTG